MINCAVCIIFAFSHISQIFYTYTVDRNNTRLFLTFLFFNNRLGTSVNSHKMSITTLSLRLEAYLICIGHVRQHITVYDMCFKYYKKIE